MDKKKEIIAIADAAIQSVAPYELIKRHVHREGSILTVAKNKAFDLSRYNQIFVIGAGKATAPMAKAMEEILEDAITAGIIGIKPGHGSSLKKIKQIEGGHPVPNEGSIEAAAAIAEVADQGDEQTLFINLISGGGSALLTMPYQDDTHRLSLDDIQSTTKTLLSCGATIQEINCIRKHLSAVKGGRLAEKIYPAESVNLILSDVVGDDLQSISSGLTVPDETTYRQALDIIESYRCSEAIPDTVNQLLRAGADGLVAETPKPGDKVFDTAATMLLGSNTLALQAAAAKASSLGYNTVSLSSRITGEAREIAKFYSGIAQEAATAAVSPKGEYRNNSGQNTVSSRLYKKPACILAGGETTVTLTGDGKGGRNQEMALAFLAEVADRPSAYKNILFASVATDGNDGPTDAAGAFASAELVETAEKAGLDIKRYLSNNDAYNFFEKTGGLIKTGPTNTNVCDIQVLLVW